MDSGLRRNDGEETGNDAPKLPDTALTADSDGQAEGEQKKPESQADADTKPDKPEGYTLTFAEGTQVDTALLGEFQKTAKEIGLTVGQAQKVADLYAGHAAGLAKEFQEAQFKALNDYITTQNAKLAERPNFKAEQALALKAMKEFGSKELTEVFRQTAIGSHEAMFDFVVKVGKALGEPGFQGRNSDREKMTAAEILYPQG
jgi:hypothetical protein